MKLRALFRTTSLAWIYQIKSQIFMYTVCLPGVGDTVYLACEMAFTVCLGHEQAVKQGKQNVIGLPNLIVDVHVQLSSNLFFFVMNR